MRRYTAALLLTVAACSWAPEPTDSAFHTIGPERLLDASSEIMTMPIASGDDVKALSRWIAQERPSRAMLHCATSSNACLEAKKLLEIKGIPFVPTMSTDNTAMLVYERLVSRECAASYKDMNFDQHWQNQPDYGCAIYSNMIQHVSDKQQFINPTVMGSAPSQPLVNTLNNAYRNQIKQQNSQDSYNTKESTLDSGGGGGGGG